MANSVIGFHYSTGGNKDGTGAWIASANQRGIPVGLKGVSDYGLIYEATEKGNQYGVDNWLVYRLSKAAGSVSRETPNYTVDPSVDSLMLANEAIDKLPPEFDNTKVWVELINEPRGKATNEPVWNNLHPVDYLGWWCYYAAVYLNSLGFKFCGPSFNSGEPGDDGKGLGDAVIQYSQPGMLKYLTYCAANPDKAALAVHDYIWDLPAPQYPQLWGRWEAAIAAADNAGIPRTFSIFVTEFGYSPNNAPKYPAVALDLDRYNQIAARFPQVKFAAAWTLQSGYDPVDDQVVTWTNYPIDKQFDPGQQPAVTHSAFGGTLPGGTPPMPEDILINPDFEGGYATVPGHDNIRYPAGWDFWYAPESFPNPIAPNDPNAILRQPEAHVLGRESIPDNEEDDFIYDGDHTWKVFGRNRSIYFTLGQTLPPGTYDLSFHIFTDMYEWIGSKDFCNDPHCCVIWVETDQGKTAEIRPPIGQANYLTFRINVGNNGRFDVHYLLTWAVDNNGAWIDGFSAERVEAPPPPPPPGTFEERLWKASVLEQRTSGVVFNPALGLWKKILADGLHVVTHERPFEGVNYQVGEKPDKSERWVYTWTAADGIKRFKWPEDVPPPPPPPPTGPTINDVVDQLATHPTLTYTTRPLSAITTLTIHHSVSGGGSNPLAEVKSIAQYHVNEPPNGRGWPGIGYHFCIGANGAIYQVNRLTTKSYHAGSYNAPGDENYWSAGICLLGNFTDNQPPQAQLDAARSLVAYLKSQLDTVTAVTRHRDMPGASTQCPGNTSPGWIGYVSGEGATIDLRRFMIADPAAFRVVRMPDGRQEEIQDMQLGGGLFVRRKNDLGEWWKVDGQYFYLVHDTSPDTGGAGIERVYTLTKGSLLGAPKNPLFMTVGQSWQETGTHYVQFRAKNGCGLLAENSGFARNTAVLVDHQTNVVFNEYGQNLTIDEVVWIKTGTEMQIYGRHNGKAVGWLGWSAPWGKSEIVELYWNRPPMTEEPNRYCSW